MVSARQVINSTKTKNVRLPKGATKLGSAGYDNPRDDIEKVKKLREGSIEKTPSLDNDITHKKYVDDAIDTDITTHAADANAHHAEVHTHTHASTTGQTANDHHNESHTIVSHSDTSATGSELDTLTDNSIANTLHRHSELVASDGSPDPAVSVDAAGDTTFAGKASFSANSTIEYTTDHLSINKTANEGVRLFESAATGERPEFRVYGYADSGAGLVYGLLTLDTYNNFVIKSNNGQVVAQSDIRITSSGGLNLGQYVADNIPVKFGAGADATISYDGTDLIVNPQSVGAGDFKCSAGAFEGAYKSTDGSAGITATITTAKLTAGGANGSMTFKNGILTAQTQAT